MSVIDNLSSPGLYLITDTLENDGTGFLLSLLKQLSLPNVFLSSTGNFAHYSTLFKKHSIDPTFIEFETAWNTEDFPLLEEPPITYNSSQNTCKIEGILKKSEKFSKKCQVCSIDNIYPIYLLKGLNYSLQLIFSLKAMFQFVIVKIPQSILPQFWILNESSDAFIEIRELESGFSSWYSGRIKISQRHNHIKEEIGTYWFSLKRDEFKIIE